tara:strand:- start:445 stop:591 length:147 start_codon:yes stop_codon:yes gene_type:complete
MWKFFSILLLILLSLVRAEVQEFPIIENKKRLQDFEQLQKSGTRLLIT